MDIKEKVIKAFYNPTTGLTRNIAKLKEKNPDLYSIPAEAIRSILDQNITLYQRNKAKLHSKEKLSFRSDYIGQLIHADLMFVKSPRNTTQEILIKDEDGEDNRYVLILVDTYSRYIWAYTLKTKSAKEVTRLIKDTILFIREFFYNGYSALRFTVYTDAGTEFSTKDLEKIKNVEHTIAKQHASLAEAAIYRLRTKIKYLDGPAQRKKLDNETFLELIRNLNLDSNADAVFEKDDLPKESKEVVTPTEDPLYNQGDFVRVEKQKELFEKKSSLSTFSEQVFIVGDVVWFPYDAVWVYKLMTPDGEMVSSRNWLAKDLTRVPFTYVTDNAEEIKDQKFTKDETKLYFLTD